MKELPNISNETQIVQDWLTREVNSNDIAEKYGISNGKQVSAKVRRERKTPAITINSKDELLEVLDLVPGKITLARWLGLSPAKSSAIIHKYLMPDELLISLYVDKGMSNKEITAYINHPYATLNFVSDRIKRLHLKHKHSDKEAIRMKGIADYLNDEERVGTRNEHQREAMINKYGVDSISPFAAKEVQNKIKNSKHKEEEEQ